MIALSVFPFDVGGIFFEVFVIVFIRVAVVAISIISPACIFSLNFFYFKSVNLF